MANYCYTNLYVYGPQEELANLFKKLKRWTRKDERKPKTAFGCGWLGFIAEGAGIQTFELRSGVEKIQFDGKGQLFIKYISADGPQPAFWEALVRKFAPRSWSCYLAEESCTGLYLTNEAENYRRLRNSRTLRRWFLHLVVGSPQHLLHAVSVARAAQQQIWCRQEHGRAGEAGLAGWPACV